jgi:hypothetical protein
MLVVKVGNPKDYAQIIPIEPGKRSGKPCIRVNRMTAQDTLGDAGHPWRYGSRHVPALAARTAALS